MIRSLLLVMAAAGGMGFRAKEEGRLVTFSCPPECRECGIAKEWRVMNMHWGEASKTHFKCVLKNKDVLPANCEEAKKRGGGNPNQYKTYCLLPDGIPLGESGQMSKDYKCCKGVSEDRFCKPSNFKNDDSSGMTFLREKYTAYENKKHHCMQDHHSLKIFKEGINKEKGIVKTGSNGLYYHKNAPVEHINSIPQWMMKIKYDFVDDGCCRKTHYVEYWNVDTQSNLGITYCIAWEVLYYCPYEGSYPVPPEGGLLPRGNVYTQVFSPICIGDKSTKERLEGAYGEHVLPPMSKFNLTSSGECPVGTEKSNSCKEDCR